MGFGAAVAMGLLVPLAGTGMAADTTPPASVTVVAWGFGVSLGGSPLTIIHNGAMPGRVTVTVQAADPDGPVTGVQLTGQVITRCRGQLTVVRPPQVLATGTGSPLRWTFDTTAFCQATGWEHFVLKLTAHASSAGGTSAETPELDLVQNVP